MTTSKYCILTPDVVINAAVDLFGVSRAELCGQTREQPYATLRQITMFVCREITECGYVRIGRDFGGRDSSTVMHAVKRIAVLKESDPRTAERVGALMSVCGWRP